MLENRCQIVEGFLSILFSMCVILYCSYSIIEYVSKILILLWLL
jgi:hypothetical protein